MKSLLLEPAELLVALPQPGLDLLELLLLPPEHAQVVVRQLLRLHRPVSAR